MLITHSFGDELQRPIPTSYKTEYRKEEENITIYSDESGCATSGLIHFLIYYRHTLFPIPEIFYAGFSLPDASFIS